MLYTICRDKNEPIYKKARLALIRRPLGLAAQTVAWQERLKSEATTSRCLDALLGARVGGCLFCGTFSGRALSRYVIEAAYMFFDCTGLIYSPLSSAQENLDAWSPVATSQQSSSVPQASGGR